MASTKRVFYVVDLIRADRKLFPNFEVPPIRVNITIDVNKDNVPKSKMDRLEKAARESLDKSEDILTEILKKENARADAMFKKDLRTADAQKMLAAGMELVKQVQVLIANAEKIAQVSAEKAVADTLKKEAQGDALLKDAQIKTTIVFVTSAIKVATSVTRIGVSHGGDVHAWISLAEDLFKVGAEINKLIQTEPQLRKSLTKGIEAYIALRDTSIMEIATKHGLTGKLPGFPDVIMFVANGAVAAGKEVGKQDAGKIAKDVKEFVVAKIGAEWNNAEKSRQAYREQTTKMRHHVDEVSAKGDKLFGEMKKVSANPDQKEAIKQGVKVGAACMQVRGRATQLGKALDDAVKFLEESQATMVDHGLTCSDATIMEKIKAFDTSTIFSEGQTIVEGIKNIYDLSKTVASAVA
jgi:hypothetical protein